MTFEKISVVLLNIPIYFTGTPFEKLNDGKYIELFIVLISVIKYAELILFVLEPTQPKVLLLLISDFALNETFAIIGILLTSINKPILLSEISPTLFSVE